MRSGFRHTPAGPGVLALNLPATRGRQGRLADEYGQLADRLGRTFHRLFTVGYL